MPSIGCQFFWFISLGKAVVNALIVDTVQSGANNAVCNALRPSGEQADIAIRFPISVVESLAKEISVLEGQLKAKRMEWQENINAKVGIEAKMKEVSKEL